MRSEDIQFILALCHKAGQSILDFYHKGNAKVRNKKDLSPVTEADLSSNALIIEGLLQRFPDIPVISEENDILPFAVRKKWDMCWLLDPLDGTREFIGRTGEFAINLALISHQKVIAGFVHIPVKDCTYYAVKNEGTFYVHQNVTRKINVLPFPSPYQTIRVAVSRYHVDEATEKYVNSLPNIEKTEVGSSLKVIEIVAGRVDMYPRLSSLSEWDMAAPHLILEEAGGSFLSYPDLKEIVYNTELLKVPPFMASSKPGSRLVS